MHSGRSVPSIDPGPLWTASRKSVGVGGFIGVAFPTADWWQSRAFDLFDIMLYSMDMIFVFHKWRQIVNAPSNAQRYEIELAQS